MSKQFTATALASIKKTVILKLKRSNNQTFCKWSEITIQTF